MRTPGLKKHILKLWKPTRVFVVFMLVAIIYLFPFGEKPEFIEYNGGIIEVSQVSPILKSFYPEASYATCGAGGTGTNCHTGCCRAGACVVCPPQPDDQPPTISGVLNCSQIGNSGWCAGNLSLDLSASDPQGHAVLISGLINGVNFACSTGATSCLVPITEVGTGTISYRVDAASGLSDSDSVNYQLDASTPALNGTLSGVNGNNGWYRSNATLTITSNDDVSGLASTTVDVDGSGPVTYISPITFIDGVYNVVLAAADNAGNLNQTTQTIQVDTVTPSLSTSLSGASGASGWYVSNVTITPSANDSTSGLASLEVNVDGGGYASYTAPIVFGDGIHTIQFRAIDNAGNETETSQQTIQVDTVTPSINLSISGTMGVDPSDGIGTTGWYITNVTMTANVSDAASSVGLVEAKRNSELWTAANQISFSDGVHTYQFRVTDRAGNVTTIPVQNLKVDTIAPAVDMLTELDLGEVLYYELQDDGSGLYVYRAVIEDEDERYKKIVWLDTLSGKTNEGNIRWDGRFADGTQAGFGEYMITLKISDVAGNETMKTAFMDVGLFSFLNELPAFVPPQFPPLPDSTIQTESSSLTFGSENNNTEANGETTINEGGTTLDWGEGDYVTAGFNVPSETILPLNANSTSGTNPLTPANILFGAAATAILGMTLAEWEKKREEERKRQEEEQAKEDRMNIKAKRQQQKDAEEAVRERWAQEEYLQNYAEHIERKMERIDAAEDAKWTTTVSAIQKRKEEEARQERMNERMEDKMAQVDVAEDAEWTAVQEAEIAGASKVLAVPVPDGPPSPKTFLEIVIDWLADLWNGDDAVPNNDAVQVSAIQTAWSYITQTAQVLLTPSPTQTPIPTPTATPTRTPTPIVMPTAYITGQDVRLRSDPNLKASYIELDCGTGIVLNGDTVFFDNKTWQPVIYNGINGWIAADYIDSKPLVCGNFAAQYAKYPGAGEAIQLTQVPFDRAAELSSWWGFGDTNFARAHRNDYYQLTTGLHSGLDWGIPLETPLIWNGNVPGKIIDSNKFIYMKNESYIIVEAEGFHFIYGHVSSADVGPGDTVTPGQVIGYSGQDKYGNVHLHFEVRPQPTFDAATNKHVRSSIVINPLTFFSDDLSQAWAPVFTGSDYPPGVDSLSLGYYRNTMVQP